MKGIFHNMEGVVHDGWLVKSPPEKRILKAKWRQRWFVLRHSGLLPGQFVLEYFTDHTCKKLKGKIDLDQCEQVDAGLNFESKKTSYQYMFDIRTPKRIYYLVAETEADMNKWVDCICSVCGLKIHIEEDYIATQDSVAVPVITSMPSLEITPSVSTSSLAVTRSGSNPYIPISECHTGKPIANGNVPFRDSFGDLPKEAPPPPPKSDQRHERAVSGEFYDYPRPINPLNVDDRNRTSPELNLEDLYKVPPRLKIPMTFDIDNAYNTMIEGDTWHSLPPRVNWHTYPRDSLQSGYGSEQGRTSVGSTEAVVYDLVPPVHTLNKEIETVRREAQELSIQLEHMNLNDSSIDTQLSSCDALHQDGGTETLKAPPRPPKPSKLRDKHRYENFELPQQSPKTEDFTVYDIPPSSKGVFLSKHLPAQAFSYLKNEHDELSPSGQVSSSVKEMLLDDTYDFPKFRSENNINATVPPPHSTASQRHRRHAYTNAPPGLFNSKELIFNYEYRPSLTTSDGYVSMYSSKQELYTDMSGDPQGTSPVIGAYANVPTSPSLAGSCQSDTPPAVNRELKPRRRFSIGEGGSPNFLTLQPPPICRSRTKATKRSFRKPRAAPSPTPLSGLNGTPPPVPTRLRHRPELSTSDDDLSSSGGSRRNSSNDEQARHFFTMPSKKNEIQYLDLDLDSEPAQSPKSPERLSASTVYKKVDFVKTKAFNEMRQNVEESYRKSQ